MSITLRSNCGDMITVPIVVRYLNVAQLAFYRYCYLWWYKLPLYGYDTAIA